MVYQAEKLIHDSGEQIAEDDKKTITDAVEKLKAAIQANNNDDMKQETENVQQAIYQVTTKMYQNAQQQHQDQNPGEGGPSDGGPDQGGTYDADYTENE